MDYKYKQERLGVIDQYVSETLAKKFNELGAITFNIVDLQTWLVEDGRRVDNRRTLSHSLRRNKIPMVGKEGPNRTIYQLMPINGSLETIQQPKNTFMLVRIIELDSSMRPTFDIDQLVKVLVVDTQNQTYLINPLRDTNLPDIRKTAWIPKNLTELAGYVTI